MGAAGQVGATPPPRAPPPNAAPAHLFEGPAPSSSLVLYGPEVLRTALHSALARAELADVQLCCDRGAPASARRAALQRRDCSRAARSPRGHRVRRRQPGVARRRCRPGHDAAAHRGALGDDARGAASHSPALPSPTARPALMPRPPGGHRRARAQEACGAGLAAGAARAPGGLRPRGVHGAALRRCSG